MLLIGSVFSVVRNVDYLLGSNQAREWMQWPRANRPTRRNFLGYVAQCTNPKSFGVIQPQYPKLGFANLRRILQYCLEYRLQLTGRRTDDTQHLGCGRLLLQRLPQLIQQPRVLDGDDGLVGKGCDQFDLLICEGTNFIAGEREDSDRRAIAQ